MHNGFLTVEGKKMSKSLGNFITVKDLREKGVHGEVLRLLLFSNKNGWVKCSVIVKKEKC